MARIRKPTKTETVTVSRESSFHALGLENPDDLVLRSLLIRKVGEVIKAKKISQTAIAERIGMDQPRVSALLAGKISKFSTDRLVTVLTIVGQDVEVRVKPSRKSHGALFVAA